MNLYTRGTVLLEKKKKTACNLIFRQVPLLESRTGGLRVVGEVLHLGAVGTHTQGDGLVQQLSDQTNLRVRGSQRDAYKF